MWHSIIESPNKGIFGDVNIFWGCVFEQLSPNLLSFKIPSISYDRRTPTPSVLSHRGEHTPSNVASIAEPNTNLFDCPTLVPTTQHSTKEPNTPPMITQNKNIAKGTTRAAQVVPVCQPGCEKMERKWENYEEMRKWKDIYSLHFLIFSLFPPSLSIS